MDRIRIENNLRLTYVPVLGKELMARRMPKQASATIGEQTESNFRANIEGDDVQDFPFRAISDT